VSIGGKIYQAIDRAVERGCETMQIFSRSPRGWRVKPLVEEDVEEFKRRREASGITPLVVHIPYLINIASPDDEFFSKCVEAFIEDIKRADALGAEFFVTHIGNHKGAGIEVGIKRVAEALTRTFEEYEPRVEILLENTAGAGTELGGEFWQIARIIELTKGGERVGVCFDTCHAFVAGYDIAHPEGLEATFDEIDKLIGFQRVKVIHTNDSKGELGSHKDRHEHIGEGFIGNDGLRLIVNHPRLREHPFILETPVKSIEDDLRNLKAIRALVEG